MATGDNHGFVKCPMCGRWSHLVVHQDFDGHWVYLGVEVGQCDDGFIGAGKHVCEGMKNECEAVFGVC